MKARLVLFSLPVAAVLAVLLLWLGAPAAPRVLVFSKTEGFRHASIEAGQDAFRRLGEAHGFSVTFTEDAARFQEDSLKRYDAVVFLNTTGDVLDARQQRHFQRYIQAGGGYVGLHAAADTEYGWSWYGRLAGAYFAGHPSDPNVREGVLTVVEADHAATQGLPSPWTRRDEWYDFRDLNPDVQVLLTIDEASYKTPEENPSDGAHPAAWYHAFDGGRAFYTALGHTPETFQDALFLDHLWGGLQYAFGERALDYERPGVQPEENRFARVVLDQNLYEPMELDLLDAGRILFVERRGAVKLHDAARAETTVLDSIPVFTEFEEGLLGVAVDPNYAENHWVYFSYSHPVDSLIQVGRFKLEGDSLARASEQVLLEIPVQRETCCHVAGALQFGPDGNLFISIGDNTNPFASDGFAPIDERPGRSSWDAQQSAANSDDLRGKILRIRPTADGSYTIPEGNLFADSSEGRPEIYVMGNRNPFRFSIDARTGFLYWGEVGPDAGEDRPQRGPKGHDEVNQARQAGFFGWPYFVGDNKAYHDYDFAADTSGAAFDPARPVNASPNNTGARTLPPAQPAFLWYPYGPSEAFPEVGEGSRNAMAGPVYHYDDYPDAPRNLPRYFDGKLFVYDWARGRVMTVTMDEEGRYAYMEPFMPGTSWSRPVDMRFGPDGALYVLEYGAAWYEQNPDARLSRIEYNGGNRPPDVQVAASETAGAAPLTVNFTAEAADLDGDALRYAWTFGDGREVDGPAATHTFAQPGTYTAALTVTDAAGVSVKAETAVQVGNEPPDVTMDLAPNRTFFWDDTVLDYSVAVTDREDGNLADGTIAPRAATLTIDYLAEGFDETEIAQGHQAQAAQPAAARLLTEARCDVCHQRDAASVGPSLLAIAERYRGQAVEDRLVRKVVEGGSGAWGARAMAAHPHLEEADVRAMVQYILELKEKEVGKEGRLPLAGRYALTDHAGDEEGDGRYLITASYTDEGAAGATPLTRRASVVLRPPRVQAEALEGPNVHERTEEIDSEQLAKGAFEVVAAQHGDAFYLPSVDLRGVGHLAAQVVQRREMEDGVIEVRLDGPEGRLLGTLGPLASAPGEERLLTVQTDLASTDGVHNVYVVFRNPEGDGAVGEVDWFLFQKE